MLGLAMMALMIMSVLVPLAQAGHFQVYYTEEAPGNKEFIGTFESDPDTTPNSGIPTAFRGLQDDLASTVGYAGTSTTGVAGVAGAMVLDSQWADAVAPAGPFVPANYYLAQQTGDEENRLFAAGAFMAWHGYWWDVNGNGVIEDTHVHYDGAMDATTQPHRKDATDEFVWRGESTGEPTTMQAYIFPADRIHGWLCTPPGFGVDCAEEPSGFDGNCARYQDGAGDTNCYNPEPDFTYADRSGSASGAGNQMWVNMNGWNDFVPEQWLVTGYDVITVVGANTVQSPEKYDVSCAASGDTCLRDYDRYTALAGDDVSDLYLNTLHIARDEVWTKQVPVTGVGTISVDRLWEDGIAVDIPNACPWQPSVPVPGEVPIFGGDDVSVCGKDTLHEDMDGRGNATDGSGQKSVRKTQATVSLQGIIPLFSNVGGSFEQYWCNTVTGGASQCGALTGHGVYGFQPASVGVGGTANSGMMFHGLGMARSWDDTNGDGYIGAPSQAEVDAYNAGIDNSPNNLCTSGADCEMNPHSSAFSGKLVRVWPCQEPVNGACVDGGWPPGSFVSRVYDRWADGRPFYPDSNWAWFEQSTPMFGGEPIDLRFDGASCDDSTISCRTQDAVALFSSMSTLSGLSVQVGTGTTDVATLEANGGASPTFATGMTLTWTEGSTEFDITYDLTNSYNALPYEDDL